MEKELHAEYVLFQGNETTTQLVTQFELYLTDI